MASYFTLTLDTLAPSEIVFTINDGALYAPDGTVKLTFTTGDQDTTGYQMLIWGVEGAENEEDAVWETFTPNKTVTLPEGDGLKTVYVKVRDDLGNTTETFTASITLDTKVPIVTVTGPDKPVISKVPGHNTAIVNFMSDVEFVEYKVCVVPDANSTHNAGTVIGTENGSTNTSGTAEDENFPAETNIEVSITGEDLDIASPGDGAKIIKIFVRNIAGTWSVA